MNYRQARRHYNLSPFGDVDRDGVQNAWDCKPFNPFKQDDDEEETYEQYAEGNYDDNANSSLDLPVEYNPSSVEEVKPSSIEESISSTEEEPYFPPEDEKREIIDVEAEVTKPEEERVFDAQLETDKPSGWEKFGSGIGKVGRGFQTAGAGIAKGAKMAWDSGRDYSKQQQFTENARQGLKIKSKSSQPQTKVIYQKAPQVQYVQPLQPMQLQPQGIAPYQPQQGYNFGQNYNLGYRTPDYPSIYETQDALARQGRKVPPGAQQYAPVTAYQSFLKKPLITGGTHADTQRPADISRQVQINRDALPSLTKPTQFNFNTSMGASSQMRRPQSASERTTQFGLCYKPLRFLTVNKPFEFKFTDLGLGCERR